MLYRVIAYLRFLFTATNQHGVHSPFVYKYITQGVYGKPDVNASKTTNVLLKSMVYFKVTRLLWESNDMDAKQKVLNKFQNLDFGPPPFDLIYIHDPGVEMQRVFKKKNVHNDTVVLIENIHGSKKNLALWNTLKNKPYITVSIDMFYCGALFFRKEQAKEHFRIRI
ncbi:MAG: hypothetical protein AAFO99_00885 [Bacteroidota bacterium]